MLSWNGRKQTSVAFSATEAEYIAMCDACSDIKWIRTFTAELSFTLKSPTALYCDNTVASHWAERSVSMRRAKHIDSKYHFVKECTAYGIVSPRDIDFNDNPANGFTKPLMKTMFEKLRDLIRLKLWK